MLPSNYLLFDTIRHPFSEPIIMPDWKFFRTNGNAKSTGMIERMIAASETVIADTLCIIVSGRPSVIVDVEIAFSRKCCKVCSSSDDVYSIVSK